MTITNKTIASMKGLALDAINKATQGHIGMALGAAPITYALIGKTLNFSPLNSKWINRDRFVMSAGHGSMAYYSILHFMGLLSLADIKAHKQLHSKTPSHPEIEANQFVDASTGPLGQGLAMGVGMAVSSLYLQNRFNKRNYKIFDHKIFVLVGDGCLQEGVALEAIQLAGTLQLKDLVIVQDYNGIQIDSQTSAVNKVDIISYFKSQHFKTYELKDDAAPQIARILNQTKTARRPTFIRIHTTIAKDTPFAGTKAGHNNVLTAKQTRDFKQKLRLTSFTPFVYDQAVYRHAKTLLAPKNAIYTQHLEMLERYKSLPAALCWANKTHQKWLSVWLFDNYV